MTAASGTKRAFKMRLKPGARDEYCRLHDEIWPELATLLSENGISDYSIFLDSDGVTLFAVLREQTPEEQQALSQRDVMRRWWRAMEPLMEMDDSGQPWSEHLEQVFYLT